MRFPSVNLFKEWQPWANALIRVLSQPQELKPLTLARYTTADLATVMPNQDGLIIWNIDNNKLAYSYNGHWYLVYNNGLIV